MQKLCPAPGWRRWTCWERKNLTPEPCPGGWGGGWPWPGRWPRAARILAPQVRGLVLCAPSGGEELARALQWEFGLPVRPAGEYTPVCLWLGGAGPERGGEVFSLREDGVDLAGFFPKMEEIDHLPTLAALWEAGYIPEGKLTFFKRET